MNSPTERTAVLRVVARRMTPTHQPFCGRFDRFGGGLMRRFDRGFGVDFFGAFFGLAAGRFDADFTSPPHVRND